MKTDLLPKRTAFVVRDRDDQPVSIDVRVLKRDGEAAVFMADRPEAPGRVARSSAVFIPQLLARLQLDRLSTRFYRYVYTPAMGAQFGAFDLVWSDNTLASYKMRMLNNLDEGPALVRWMAGAAPVIVSYAAARDLLAPELAERQIS